MNLDSRSIEGILAKRFKIDPPPTLIGRASTAAPVVFSRLRSTVPQRGRSLSVPAEDAFTFQVPLAFPFFSGIWVSGKPVSYGTAALGSAFLFDLSANPRVGLETTFDSVRIYLSKAAMDGMSLENGQPRVGGLKARGFGEHDLVLHGFALAAAGAMEQHPKGSTLFADQIALALYGHVLQTYGSMALPRSKHRAGLSPWQLRRARAFVEARLSEDPSLAELAAECGLSPRYFARAFKNATGIPPHRWIIMRRLDRAKDLLTRNAMPLTDIAAASGFSDQSYLTRMFTRYEGVSPGKWRRDRRA